MSTNSQRQSPQGEDVLPHVGVVREESDVANSHASLQGQHQPPPQQEHHVNFQMNGQAFTAPHPKPPPPFQQQLSQRKGRSNYIHDETMALLDILERRLPIGPEEWDAVSDEHALNFPKRSVDSIRRKFAGLHRRQPGTGNPNCPPEVEQAKRIKQLIGERANIGTQDEEFDLASQSFISPNVDKEIQQINSPPQSTNTSTSSISVSAISTSVAVPAPQPMAHARGQSLAIGRSVRAGG